MSGCSSQAPRRRRAPQKLFVRATGLLAVLLLGGCSTTATSSAPATPSGPGSSISAPSSDHCLSGAVTIDYPPGDNPLRSACVHVGVVIDVTLNATGGFVWTPLTDSDPSTAAITSAGSGGSGGGSVHAQVRAVRPGTCTLSSSRSYTPDPHGPPTTLWTLTLRVVG